MNNWLSYQEHQPSNNGWYVVNIKSLMGGAVGEESWPALWVNGKFLDTYGKPMLSVTHWMPIPVMPRLALEPFFFEGEIRFAGDLSQKSVKGRVTDRGTYHAVKFDRPFPRLTNGCRVQMSSPLVGCFEVTESRHDTGYAVAMMSVGKAKKPAQPIDQPEVIAQEETWRDKPSLL